MSAPVILLVEDEPSYVEALEVGLKREGFVVEVARDGVEALARFDIVQPMSSVTAWPCSLAPST